MRGSRTQRERLIAAMGEMVTELGWPAVGVHHICQRAGISRRTFYELYRDGEACFLDGVSDAYEHLLAEVDRAVASAPPYWEDRAVAAIASVISAWEADRVLADLCVVAPLSARGPALQLRRNAIARVGRLLGDAPDPPPLSEIAATGAIGAVWELIHHRLTEDTTASLSGELEAAIYLTLSPFVGSARAVTRAATMAQLPRTPGTWPVQPAEAEVVVTELTGQTLRYLNGHPGAANIDIARAVDVRHESQMSRHLSRLERAGMVSHRKEGRTNAWQLTARGEEAARTLHDLRADLPRLTPGIWASTNHQEA